MIDIGVDDGGAGQQLCVSMHVGDTTAQRRLSDRWQCLLEQAGLPFFHSKDYDNFSGGTFGCTPRGERRELLRELSGLVHEAGDFGLTVIIDKTLYDRLANNEFKSQWGAAFSFAAQVGLIAIAQIFESWGATTERVNLLVERGHKNCEQLIQQLQPTVHQSGYYLNLNFVGSAPKEGNPILQVADMLAYGFWSGGEIGDAIHKDRGTYQSFLLRCSEELINRTFSDIRAEIARRKSFGARRPRTSA